MGLAKGKVSGDPYGPKRLFMPYQQKKLGLLDILISLPVDPAGMLRYLLLERRRPPYLISVPIALLLVLVGPCAYFQYKLRMYPADVQLAAAVTTTTVLTIVSFVFFMTVLLKVLLIRTQPIQVLAATLYSLASFIPFMLAYYLLNFLASGRLTILTYLASGTYPEGDWVVALFPTTVQLASLCCFFIFMNAIKVMGSSKPISAISTAVLAIPVLVGAFAVSITLTNVIFKNSGIPVYRFITTLFSGVIL